MTAPTEQPPNAEPRRYDNEYYEMARQLPGVDPVIAAIEGQTSQLPPTGYLVFGRIHPGERAGGFDVMQYDVGELSLARPDDHRDTYGSAHAYATIQDGAYTTVLVRPRRDSTGFYVSDTREVRSSTSETHQLTSGILAVHGEPLHYPGSTIGQQLSTYDPKKDRLYSDAIRRGMDFARIVQSSDEFTELSRALGASIGLNGSDFETFVFVMGRQAERMPVAELPPEEAEPRRKLWSRLGVLIRRS